jgi:O-antigen/teichoic acid export membrane protein
VPEHSAADRLTGESSEDAAIQRHLVRSTFTNYAGQIVTLGVWFALTPFILHRLGPTQYGLWVLVASFVAYGTVLDFGVGMAVTKYVAELRARGQPDQASSFVATALRLYCVLGLLVLAASIPLALLAPHVFNVPSSERTTLSWLVVVTGVGIAVQLPATTAYAVLRGLQRFDVINLISSLGVLALAAATVVVLLLGGGVLGIAAMTIPLTVLGQVPMIHFIRRTMPELRFGWRGARADLVRTVVGFSSSLVLINASAVVKRKTDELVIGAALPIARVTPYAVARRVSDVPEMFTYQFIRVLMPLASHLHGKEDRERLRTLYVASTRLALALYAPIGGALVVLAGPLLTAWVGARYAGNADIVLILTAAGMLEIGLYPATSVLQGIGRHRPIALFSAGSAVLNLVLSIVLVRTMGVTGVALGTLIATAVEAFVVMPWALSAFSVSARTAVMEVFVPAIAPAVPMVLVLLALRELSDPSSLVAVGLVGALGALVYAAGYLAFRVSARERHAVLRLAFGTLARLRALFL